MSNEDYYVSTIKDLRAQVARLEAELEQASTIEVACLQKIQESRAEAALLKEVLRPLAELADRVGTINIEGHKMGQSFKTQLGRLGHAGLLALKENTRDGSERSE